LLFGSIIGLLVSFYATRRIRKYHLANLESLKKLYNNLNDE
jgi:membrane protein DedA with SNARE-associated domain